jgi:uncharacterized membrane protein YqgA involved in biofilm formation
MIGTIINFGTILIGGALGLLLGSKLHDRVKATIMSGLGIFTFAYAISLFLKTKNPLIVLGSILIGVLLGEWWRIQEGIEKLAEFIESRFNRNGVSEDRNLFIKGFLTSTLVFCIGPMAILGSLEDGISGNINTLVVKSILDGFGAMAFASTLGPGVLFSSFMVLVYQGAISLTAHQVQKIATTSMMEELTATGGIILVGIAMSSLLELKKIRTASFLPALIIAPIIVYILSLLK